jgi:hypothetical protein
MQFRWVQKLCFKSHDPCFSAISLLHQAGLPRMRRKCPANIPNAFTKLKDNEIYLIANIGSIAFKFSSVKFI